MKLLMLGASTSISYALACAVATETTPYEERKALQRERKVVKKDRQLDIRQKRKDKRSQAY